MEILTAVLEAGKEVLKETAKAAVKATETAAEAELLTGGMETEKLVSETALEKELNAASPAQQISFGSLANGEFKGDERYLRWKDGIDTGEVNPKWIGELANEIAAIYGDDHLTVKKKYIDIDPKAGIYRFDNAAMYDYLGKLVYDPKYLRDNGNLYGTDNILGTLAHEVGHRLVNNLGLRDTITLYENEACADYIAGLTTRLCQMDGTHKFSWFNSCPAVSADGVHPGKSVRMEAFIRGFDRIDRGQEAARLKIFEEFSPYDLEGIYKNPDLLREILYEDVIHPLRNGEIKKV